MELVSEQRPLQTSALLQSPFVHFGAALANASAFALGQQRGMFGRFFLKK
jgi:hypothetical protein